MKIVQMIILSFFFQSCFTSKNNSEIAFANKYFDEDFSDFKNSDFVIRGLDNDGNYIVLKFDAAPCGFLGIILDKDSLSLLSIEPIYQSNYYCSIDTSYSNYLLAKKFINYNIQAIEVDNNNNVYVKTKFYEGRPNLVRFSDRKFVKDIDTSKWDCIRGNWYLFTDQ